MADASKSSLLSLTGITNWGRSRTPPPPPPKSPAYPPKEDSLKQSRGEDHTFSLRPSPSLRRYPSDCPALRTKWFYAVDVAKRKPFTTESTTDDKVKPPAPKKLVPFSESDSQAIENGYQSLDTAEFIATEENVSSGKAAYTKVPVNEDYLFDVNVEKRELEPAYWLGPVYEVRRGSWFYSDGSTLRPCDENLANQIEEGYLKTAVWRKSSATLARSSSQSRNRQTSLAVESSVNGRRASGSTTPTESTTPNDQYVYRLFGTHMSTTVTYLDATIAILSQDDLLSRMSSSVYGRFGGYGGTKVVRGWSDSVSSKPEKQGDKVSDTKTTTTEKQPNHTHKRGKSASGSHDTENKQVTEKDEEDLAGPHVKSALELQLSSLAGLAQHADSASRAEEEAREQEERDLEDAREKGGEDQNRHIDHLVLVTHGIGQRLGLRLESVNFVHDVNTLRKTLKAVYGSAPDLQALSGLPENCRIQVLPITWRHLLDFPKQSLKQNRKEYDLADIDPSFDDEYPSLHDITVEGVPAVRNLITDLAMDVLLYQSAYREHIATIVTDETNRVYSLFKKRTGFHGKVSLVGHSLGSAIYFDILCRQDAAQVGQKPRRVSTHRSRESVSDSKDLKLNFEVENFFALGSPIALFQMLKGRTVSGRRTIKDGPLAFSPFDPDPLLNDPYNPFGGTGSRRPHGVSKDLIPITTSSPKCVEFYNIFHPTDPIAYRIEPLISPAMAQMKAQPLPYTKRGLFDVPGIANISARVSQQIQSGWYSITSGVASSLINRSLGITGEEQVLAQDKARTNNTTTPNPFQLSSGVSASGDPLQASQTANIARPQLIADDQKQEAVARAASVSMDLHRDMPTLIDSEIETLYSGFQKRHTPNSSPTPIVPSGTPPSLTGLSTTPSTLGAPPNPSTLEYPSPNTAEHELEHERLRKLRREEAKVKALNSNGRVDYHIQEGMFDVSLLASIASHLTYWSDEDVMHFMIGQMLKTGHFSTETTKVKDKNGSGVMNAATGDARGIGHRKKAGDSESSTEAQTPTENSNKSGSNMKQDSDMAQLSDDWETDLGSRKTAISNRMH